LSASDSTEDVRPKLRPVEALPGTHQGRQVIMLIDPTGLARGTVSLSSQAFFIVSHFDGRHDLRDIQADFTRRYGELLMSERVHDMIQQLEQAGFLDGPHFERYYAALATEYEKAPTRQTHTTIAPAELQQTVDDILATAKNLVHQPKIVGLIAPHLDYERGRSCYVAAYAALKARSNARRFVILGTNHFGRAQGVVATDKSFETPLGLARIDQTAMRALRRRCGAALLDHQFDHQHEHSVELQVMLLQRLFGPDEVRIVPLLCPDASTTEQSPTGHGVPPPELAAVLKEMLADADQPICVIAAADLSHVGRRFGDDRPLDTAFLEQVERRDRQLLKYIQQNDPTGMLDFLGHDQNPTRVCSSGCLYVALAALPDSKVELLEYHQAATAEIETAVTCAAAALTA